MNIGVGAGDDLEVMKKYGQLHVIDISASAVARVSKLICAEKKVCSVCAIDYAYNYFDVVTAFDVLEHIEDDKLAVKEINRVLKPGGLFFHLRYRRYLSSMGLMLNS